ncbi:hypothetical protein, partial [Clostridium perfringens]|uniref:hypothetical protein n=1 Tax=Clostridium perfringens TaxID=1502 RepID=UPI002AC43169
MKNNKHHQNNLQKEYNKLKKELIELHKGDDLKDFIDYDKLTIHTNYKIEILEMVKCNDEDEILNLEDEYILEAREKQKGYNQKTNEDIGETDFFKRLRNDLDESNKIDPKYYEFIDS